MLPLPPPTHHIRLQLQLILQLHQKPEIPLLRRHLRPQILQIDNRSPHPLRLQLLRRLHHQTRLAHLSGGKHIGKHPLPTKPQEFLIRLTRNIDATPRLHRAANRIEAWIRCHR